MKSLEYVKKIREDLNQCFRHWNPATMNNDNDFYHNEWETIKQDLEVLEILRKYIYLEQQCYDYDWEDGNTWMDYLSIKDIEDIDEHWQDDYKKIKQWLEENE